MILIAGLIGGVGCATIVFRKTLLGVIVGAQLIALGAVMAFVVSGIFSGEPVSGHLFGCFVAFSGLAQLSAGYALAVRLFYLRREIRMTELRTLKK